jgi:hypothetical protein
MDLGFFVRSSFLGEFFHAIKPPIKRPQLQITDVKIFIQQNNYYYNIQCEIIVLNSQERERDETGTKKTNCIFNIIHKKNIPAGFPSISTSK